MTHVPDPDAGVLERRLRHLESAERLAGIGSWQGVLGDSHEIYWSPNTYEIAGWTHDRPITFHAFLELIHPEDRDRYLRERDAALRGDAPYAMDVRVLRPDGEVRHVHLEASLEHMPDGRHHLIGVVHDRTREVQTRREIERESREVAALLRDLLRRTEHERARVADRVHDEPLHAAVAAKVLLDTTELEDDDATRDELQAVRALVDEAIGSLRSVVSEAQPTDLGDDLEQALRRAARAASPDTEVEVRVEVDLELSDLARRIAVRIAQEAVHNVRKHADAEHLELELRAMGDAAVLEVVDDGCGFDPDHAVVEPGHLGITAMRERAAAAGGTLEIESRPGRTVVRAVLPAS